MNQYQVTAENFSEDSENRIHSDEIAKRYGFRGALVPGVAVYGHLTYPLVQQFGPAWLSQSTSNVRLLKPTYDGDTLTIHCTAENNHHTVECRNQEGEQVAHLTSSLNNTPPLPDLALLENNYKHPERVEICWDNVVPEEAFTPWTFELSREENQRYVSEVKDNLSLYQEGFVHPHLLLSLANTALMNEFIMPTWLHVGSETHHRSALREGDTITIKSVPLEKWQKKGHEFIRLWVTYWRDDIITTDILHTAIFKVAN